jgi:ABC-2 type transport system ATP-binding protein
MRSSVAAPDRRCDTTELALDVRGVTKQFRRRRLRRPGSGRGPAKPPHTAVDDVSFRIHPKEIFGVIGANGSGKSTLVRVLSTLLVPDAGEVFVYGRDALRAPLSVRPLLNRVSADPSFFRAMSPMENLLFFGRAYGLAGPVVKARTRAILERLGLEPERVNEPMLRMSRGQQQKVAIARAFLTKPRLMLLDEPTTGLDPRSRRDVQAFLTEVRDTEQVAILLTTHDMEEAELLCDRIAFLAGGRIVAEGTPSALRRGVARARGVADVDMETVFMELTGHQIEDDEEINDDDR